MLHAYEEWGADVSEAVQRHVRVRDLGSARAQRLFLARDRYGVKPLYYCYGDTRLLFASEIKAILEYPDVARAVCYAALNEYFTFQNILTDLTLFEGVRLLPAGRSLMVDVRSGGQSRKRATGISSFRRSQRGCRRTERRRRALSALHTGGDASARERRAGRPAT